jgi:hypothetical protein
MHKYPLGENNQDKRYIDEKELYILFALLRNGRISSWNETFSPSNEKDFIFTEEMKKDKKILEDLRKI